MSFFSELLGLTKPKPTISITLPVQIRRSYIELSDLPGFDLFDNCGSSFIRRSKDEDDQATILYSKQVTLKEIEISQEMCKPGDEYDDPGADFSKLLNAVRQIPSDVWFRW